MDKHQRSSLCAYALLLLGLLQMLADVAGVGSIKGLAAGTLASPAPKVFCSVGDFETFSSKFILHIKDKDGQQSHMLIDKHAYAKLEGPYNRRNIYGAVISYGPVMAVNQHAKPMLDAVINYALCPPRPLLRELLADASDQRLNNIETAWIEVLPREGSRHDTNLPLLFFPDCQP